MQHCGSKIESLLTRLVLEHILWTLREGIKMECPSRYEKNCSDGATTVMSSGYTCSFVLGSPTPRSLVVLSDDVPLAVSATLHETRGRNYVESDGFLSVKPGWNKTFLQRSRLASTEMIFSSGSS